MKEKNSFIDLLRSTGSYLYSPDKLFTLTSGKKSSYYIDVKKALLTQKGLIVVGSIIAEQLRLLNTPKCVGGMTFGADPITMAATIACTNIGIAVKPLSFRKETRDHGTSKAIEGTYESGDTILLVEDVVTSGASLIKTIEIANANGLKVIGAITLVDREEGGVENIYTETGVQVTSVVTATDLIGVKPWAG